jgi:hypothetical protein
MARPTAPGKGVAGRTAVTSRVRIIATLLRNPE